MTSSVNDLRVLVDNLDEYIHIPGGIDRLKKMILHLAVSGQLVPQDPSEGTGEQLYQQIQIEKQKLIAEGKIKKQKPLPEISDDEIPFEIPGNWKWAKLGNLHSKITDGSHNPPHGDATGLPMISSRNVVDNKITLDNARYLSKDKFNKENERTRVEAGDILLTIVGTIGRTAVVNKEDLPLTMQRSVSVLTPIILNNNYVATCVFPSSYMQSILEEEATGTAQKGVYLNQIKELLLPLPPLAEQKRIVAKVDSLFALIDQLSQQYTAEQAERSKLVASSLARLARGDSTAEQNLALTHLGEVIRTKADAKVLCQTILHLAVSGQLVPQDPSEGTGEQLYRQIQTELTRGKKRKTLPEIAVDEIPFDIPGSWKWARLTTVSKSLSAGGDKPKDFTKVKTEHNDIPVIANGETNEGVVGFTKEARVTETSVTVSGRGTIGYSVVRDYPYTPIVRLLVITPPVGLLPQYVQFVFSSLFERGMGTSIPQLTVPMIAPKPIPLPPLAEQKRIVVRTTQLLDLVAELETHLEM